MNKITVQDKYTGYAEFTPRRAGIFVYKANKYLRIVKVYKIKEKTGKKPKKPIAKEYLPGTVKIQLRAHSTVERIRHKSNDWLSLPPDLILPLIKILQECYVELSGKEVPETAVFEKVSEDKELTDAIKKIGL